MLRIDISGIASFMGNEVPDFAAVSLAHRGLIEGTLPGAEFTGWRQLPRRMQGAEMERILEATRKIKNQSDVLVVVGIGGSYLGARAAIELLQPQNGIEVLFAGNSLSPDYLNEVINKIGDRDWSLNVISKSGSTLEPALSFRVLKTLLEQKYGKEYVKRLYITTDPEKGILKEFANSLGLNTFVIPEDVGGRYSVLSAVGLLPMACAGIDIVKLTNAAAQALYDYDELSVENPCWKYAATRYTLYRKGKQIELLASYEPSFRFFAEWWKQLFGESEGKDGVGIFPASLEYNADLHSMGQYIQDGPRSLFETVVLFDRPIKNYSVPFMMGNQDGLNYLAAREFSDIAKTAAMAVKEAHIAGGVPNIMITVERRDEQALAELVAFFETSCALSAYMSGVNPFNQPGVEAYKKNMKRMLED